MQAPTAKRLPAVLSPWQAMGVVIGGTIGASIFLVPSVIAQRVPFLAGVLGVWLIGAAIVFATVLTFSELSAMLPEAGGGYAYIREALGPVVGIPVRLDGCISHPVRRGGGRQLHFRHLFCASCRSRPADVPLPLWEGGAAIGLICLLSVVDSLGVRAGADVQVAGHGDENCSARFSVGLAAAVVAWDESSEDSDAFSGRGSGGGRELLAAMTPVMWTYAGWEQLAHLAEEIRDPGKNLPRVFAVGLT